MPTDSASTLMILFFLGFAALLVMFVFIMRNLESLQRNLDDTRQKFTLAINDLERQMADLSFSTRAGRGAADNDTGGGSLGELLENARAPLDLGPALERSAQTEQLPDLNMKGAKGKQNAGLDVPRDFQF